MKNLITVTVIILGIMLFQGNGMAESNKNTDLATQLAKVQAQLKQVKAELELAKVKLQLKDKQIELLTQKFAAQCKRLASSSRARYTSSSRRTNSTTNSSAAAQQAAQKAVRKKEQQQKNARLLKYYESERTELYKKIRVAEKDLKNANGTIGKDNRKYKIRQCKSTLRKLYSKRDSMNSTIKKLKYGVYTTRRVRY